MANQEVPPMRPPDLALLSKVSAELGSDPALVQGAGGNTSIKDSNRLYVKASGTRLARAADENIFVSIDLPPLTDAISEKRECDENAHRIGEAALRSSIETPLHAVIPARVVIHVHSVAAISHAVILGGPSTGLANLLTGLKWAWVPYAKPGWPLTWAVQKTLDKNPNVWVLQNHGVIVSGDSVEDALTILREFERRLETEPVNFVDPSRSLIDVTERDSTWRLPARLCIHRLGLDRDALAWATNGVMCPDQAVFLGPRVRKVADLTELTAVDAHHSAVLVEGHGVVVRRTASSAVDEMLTCLALVTAKLRPGQELQYLSDNQVLELLDWDAERYRQSLEGHVGAAC